MSDDSPARRLEADLFGRLLGARRALPAVLEPDADRDDGGWQSVGEGAPSPRPRGRVWTGIGSRETPAEILAVPERHRSPAVERTVRDWLAGRRFPLDLIWTSPDAIDPRPVSDADGPRAAP